MNITINKAKELIHHPNGQIFSSTFIKKNGQHRLMNARLKVSKGLKKDAKPRPYEPSKYNLVCVYDMTANFLFIRNFALKKEIFLTFN